jgi:hypothetical protein
MTLAPSTPPAHSVPAEAAWQLLGEVVPRTTPLLLTHGMTWRDLPGCLAEHELGDPARAPEITLLAVTLVDDRDLPCRGVPVADPATGNIRILARACTGCVFTTAPFELSFMYPLLLKRRAHLLCPATVQTDTPGTVPAICHGFAADPVPATVSIALRLAATGAVVYLDPPPTG